MGGVVMSDDQDKLYTMQEIADNIGVNKTTVYRYIKKNNIANAMIQGNANYYDATVMKRLKKHFGKENARHEERKTLNEQLIETLQQQIKELQQELNNEKNRSDKALLAKDKQIGELNARLKESHQLQLGLQKKLRILPDKSNSPVVEADAQEIINQEPNNEENTKEETHKKSFWKKIFGD